MPTYFGYMLITLGFMLIMLKDLLFPSKSKARTRRPATAPRGRGSGRC